ncbi:MAG: hypothetical protein OEV49_12140 [candidate division Zixibacteria bacterium]|nr:hypothetical protein [candidate division Zixibacteria bacterium]MDH3937310.1 hypothetical protein [candidate division Zixibacteria bacterium]MDH4033096.1 hypothetical protein [candidate division Zixibacteria bacterium]
MKRSTAVVKCVVSCVIAIVSIVAASTFGSEADTHIGGECDQYVDWTYATGG